MSRRGLTRVSHAAREQQLPEIPCVSATREFRHAVLAGLCDVSRIPGPEEQPRPAF